MIYIFHLEEQISQELILVGIGEMGLKILLGDSFLMEAILSIQAYLKQNINLMLISR